MDSLADPLQDNGAANKRVAMAVIAYLGVFVVVSYLVAKDDPFVKFHIKQGLVLLVIEITAGFLATFMWMLWPLVEIANVAIVVLTIIGIVHAVQGKEEELPVVGKFSHHFPI